MKILALAALVTGFAAVPRALEEPTALSFILSVVNDTVIEFKATGPVGFYASGVPLGGMLAPFFTLKPQASYIGPLVYRDMFADWLELTEGEENATEVDLSEFYAFEPNTQYQVRFEQDVYVSRNTVARGTSNVVVIDTSKMLKSLTNTESTAVAVSTSNARCYFESVEGRDDYPLSLIKEDPDCYDGCSKEDIKAIADAVLSARFYAKNLFGPMFRHHDRCDIYTDILEAHNNIFAVDVIRKTAINFKRWIGAYTTTKWKKTQGVLKAMNLVLHEELKATCRPSNSICRGGVAAYVSPTSDPGRVFYCDSFFKYADKRHVLMHELTHFKNVAGAVDYCYGKYSCRAFAITHPQDTIRAADSLALLMTTSIHSLGRTTYDRCSKPASVPVACAFPPFMAETYKFSYKGGKKNCKQQ